jgi:molecular chaperone DnaK
MSYRLGVDLGTTFTAAAVANGMPPTMVGLGNRALQIPSVLFLADDSSMLVGEAAERRGLAQPDRVAREFKRRIGDTVPILVAGTPFSPQALTSRLLQHVVEIAAERLGEPPAEVVLTHPANWGPYKLELLDQAARLAGVERSIRCPEPLAAAAQYAAQTRVAVGDTIAVYDLGGGTFDACVLEKTPTGFALLGTPEGIEHLGGIDFDEALFQHVLGLLGDRLAGIDPDDPDAVVGLTRLRRDCVEAKEALSTDTDALLPVALPGISTTLRLTRSEFEGLIRPALGDTINALERAVRSADRAPDQLRAIVLVGGSSRIPLIGELLHHTLSTPTAMDTHPKHDIALGSVQADHGNWAAVAETTTMPEPPTRRTSRADTPPPLEQITLPTDPFVIRSEAGRLITQPTEQPRPTPAQSATQPATGAAPPSPAPPTIASSSPAAVQPPPGTPAPPTEIGTPARAAPGPSPDPARRRRLIILGAGAAAVIAGIVIGISVVAGLRDNGGPTSQQSDPFNTAAASTQPASTPATPTPSRAEPPGVPVSARPLGSDELYVSMQTAPGKWDLYLADITKSAPGKPLTKGKGFNLGPLPSPTSRTVIYAHVSSGPAGRRSLRVAGAADFSGDRELFALPKGCENAVRASWNPVDLDMLAMACISSAGEPTIRLVRTDGTLIRKVSPPAGTSRVDDPAFTADGKRLGFWAGPDDGKDGGVLYTEPVGGGQAVKLLDDAGPPLAGQDADLVFSPDGRYVAFRRWVPTADGKGQQDVFRASSDGTDLTRLTDDPSNERSPSWSPDSRHIAFKADRPAKHYPTTDRTWIMDADGSDQHLLWSKGAPNPQGAPGWTAR